jgi:hypothetical protein
VCVSVVCHLVRFVDKVVSKLVLEREQINATQLIMRRQTLQLSAPRPSVTPADASACR